MAKQKSIDGANLQLALKQNNEKMKGYIDASHYDIKKYQKYVNTDLDYGVFEITDMTINHTTPLVFSAVISGNMELSEQGYIKLQKGKTYVFHTNLYSTAYNTGILLVDANANLLTEKVTSRNGSYIYHANEDIEVTFVTEDNETISENLTTKWSCVNVYEINRQITIDPVEHVNESHGIEDTPVGHIIAHMGTIAPKHYLICDGTEYNIADYPYLAQHIQDNFGTVNFFGGDGIITFAIPNKNNLYTESVPAMKSNNSPFPYVVSASSNYSGRPPYYAFNKTNSNVSDLWTCLLNDNNPWIQIYSPDGVNISKFSITSRNGDDTATGYRPKIISLVGSDNEVDWVTLLDTTEVTWNGSNQTLEFILDNMYKFKYIRLYLYSNNKYTEIGRFDIYKTENIQCIKCEPTYFMNTYNTNYMQPSMYSEEEKVVGCWIDGKPLYQKTISFGAITAQHIDIPVNIENIEIAMITDGYVYDKVMLSFYPISYTNSLFTQYSNTAFVVVENNVATLSIRKSNEQTISNGYITIQYTKSTDEENSFTESMLKESYIKLDSTCTDEELQQAILDIVDEINAEPVVEPEQSIADIPVTIPEIYEEDEPGDEVIEEPEATPEEEMTEPEEVTPEVTDEPETEQTEVTEGGTNNESE